LLLIATSVTSRSDAAWTSDSLDNLRSIQESAARATREALPSVVFVGSGSGVIISQEGHVLTNDHVVESRILDGELRTIVTLALSGAQKRAVLLGRFPAGDLALLKIEEDGPFPFCELGDSDAVRPGQPVLAIGNPFLLASPHGNSWIEGLAGDYHPSVSLGVISALHRFAPPRYPDAVQVDAALNPGNSGGPLVTLDGKVIGINGKIETRLGLNINSGVGYAVPSNLAVRFLELLKQAGGQEVSRGEFSGLEVAAHRDTGAQVITPVPRGITITRVEPASSAAQVGLQRGDRIVAVNGYPVSTVGRLHGILQTYPVGSSLKFEIHRGQSRIHLITDMKKARKSAGE
jgi:serine protease Do